MLGGAADWSISQGDVAKTASLYGAETTSFPGQSHDLMLEPDWEKVALRIHEFVQARTAAGKV